MERIMIQRITLTRRDNIHPLPDGSAVKIEGVDGFAVQADGLFPVEEIDTIYNELPRPVKETAFQYGPTPGYPPLLESLTGFLRTKGLPVDTNRLMITTGS